MLKVNMKKIILILFSLFTCSYSAVIQTNLQDGLWQLVGFAGNPSADSSVSYESDTTKEIIDIADDNTTYLVKENNTDNGQLAYIRNDFTLSTSYITSTTRLKSSIGIFAIKNSLSPSGKTTLKTNITSAVKLKIKNPKVFNPNIPHYRMYLKGKSIPILRIDYQADYEGQSFRVKFANENEDYLAYFDNSKTFDIATILEGNTDGNLDIGAYSASIRDSIDFNAEDNNFTKMANGKFKIKDTNGNYNQDLTDYASSNDFNVTVYSFKDGKWDIFNSLNKASSNNFDTFDVGQGYWIKVDNARSRPAVRNIGQTALISRDSLNIDRDYSNLKNGWNIMSFKDTHLRYAPSGVFIPQNTIIDPTHTHFSIYRTQRFGVDRHSIDIPSSLYDAPSSLSHNSSQSARYVNINAMNQEKVFGYKDKIRAIPALKVEDNGSTTDGIIVMSDSKFEVSATTLTPLPSTLAGQLLKKNINQYESVYGEYSNFFTLNDLDDTDINASISLRIPKYSSSPLIVGDLNDKNKTLNAYNILKAMNTLSTKTGKTTPSNSNAVYLTDLDFTTYKDYNHSNTTTSVLIASGSRFSVADATYSKIYKFNRNGKFKLNSSDGSVDIDSGVSSDINTLITNINNAKSTTKVVATSLGKNSDGDTQFMLTSTKSGIRILENDSVNLFDDISLSSSSIANADIAKGTISSVHSFRDLLSADVSFDLEAVDKIGDFGGEKFPNFNIDVALTGGAFLGRSGTIQGNVVVAAGDDATVIPPQTLRISGSLTVGGKLSVAGTLLVGGDINIIRGAGLLIDTTGILIVRGDIIITVPPPGINEYKAESGSNTYIRGSIIGPIVGTIIDPLAVHVEKKFPISAAQKRGIGHLDTNISEVPIGLFDLKGQPFPNTTPDLKSNPSPTLDFPISGGIIEAFHKNRKKINTIMTMEYSSSNQGFWKLTDLTKNIDTLYGNSYDSDDEFNNDYQGVFHLHSNKAYWVNVDSVSGSNTGLPDINDIINMKDSKITTQSYTHFSNTFDKGISTTQNHINHRLNIKFEDKFIPLTGEGKDYYNIVAIVKGQRYYLKKDGSYFSLDINDNEMPLLEKITKIVNNNQVTEQDEAIVLEIYNGTGVAFKEIDNTSHFKIKYFKPLIPTFTWNKDNDLMIDNYNQKDIDNNISTLELYVKSVSDIQSQRNKYLLTENNLSKNKEDILKWEYGNDESNYGGLTAIRAVIKKQDVNKTVSFYSDMRAFLYAPIKRGHILETNTTQRIATKPYSYISDKNLSNNGVQISYTNRSKDITKISMSYYPQGKEGVKSLQGTGFGASRTMFLRVNTGATNKDAIASIKYIPEYIGNMFYIYFDNKLYQGRFVDNDNYSNDGNAYNLESATLSTDSFVNGNGTQADGSGGRLIDGGGQGI